MPLDKTQLTNMTTRQKAIAGGIVLVVLILLWQIIGLFGGGKDTTPAASASASLPNKNPTNINNLGAKGGMNSMPPAQSAVPQQGQLTQQQMSFQQQAELLKLQQETQQKYVIALNELQMLKLSQQIAETNKSIASAKLATVTAEKGIVDLLTKPAPPLETPSSYSPGLVTPGAPSGVISSIPAAPVVSSLPVNPISAPPQQAAPANYVVISVSKLLNKWGAVVGYQGKLYSIFVGDVLPADGSTVTSIDRYGIVLEKDGISRKISLVPII